ncbi:MAG: DUF4365 domain-containing protein [Lachnospiraceae bacterium]|nr:DUF4365 domain-containing protein [Lachnospiraceae bacterium]
MQTDRIGVNAVSFIFEKIGFVFREQLIEDYGIDALIEERAADRPSGKLIGVQIKTGAYFFREVKNNKVVFRGEMKHYDYWLNYSLPVILVLYNPETESCIYQLITKEKIVKTGKGWKTEIDCDNDLRNSAPFLKSLYDCQSEYQTRLNTLAFSVGLMELAEQGELFAEIVEWINKTSGRGDFILKRIDPDGNETILSEKSIWGFGLKSYEIVIQELFPWAAVEVDEYYYDMYGDKEFMDYAKRGRNIYPCENRAGEVDFYRLSLNLNEVGKSFLTLNTFLQEGEMYNIRF